MRKFGLIGYPLGQSFSNKFFTQKFTEEDLTDCLHEVFPIRSINELQQVLADPELEGLNVTLPYKKAVIAFLHKKDEIVEKIQACNCIKIESGVLTGFNTDVAGFQNSITPLLKSYHKKALVLGTGGASAAVQFVLERLDIEHKFVSRNSATNANVISYEEAEDYIGSHQIIINTTPVGMYPNINDAPSIPYGLLTDEHLLYDLTYNPEETQFLALGKMRGAATKNGAEMLVIQAEESWQIWNAN